MPAAAPLQPVIHGRMDFDDYTVEKVYFASLPGHYVSGNLYRPRTIVGKCPGVLCPHGHWPDGRFYSTPDKDLDPQLISGAEQRTCGARYPLQARMVGLARLGCVVFHYDMVGYADSQAVDHRSTYTDLPSTLHLHSVMGLQTFNSLRAVDFLLSLDEVDPQRIAVTGASGGGTQTFLLGAIDPRPAVAFPAVMVSTAMQGGCVCENAPYLRIGLNNVAFAAAFAPRPLAMSGADDWTINIETRGYPELQRVYSLYAATDQVYARCFPQFKHNYNEVARELMYGWFNSHLALHHDDRVTEHPFTPILPEKLSVYDADHPRPADTKTAEQLAEALTADSNRQFAEALPNDAAGVESYRKLVAPAARVLLGGDLPSSAEVELAGPFQKQEFPTFSCYKSAISRRGAGEQVPVVVLLPRDFNGQLVVWIDGQGKRHLLGENGQPETQVHRLLEAGYGIASADVFQTGEYLTNRQPYVPVVDAKNPAFTFAYNRPLVAERVHDILTLLAGLRSFPTLSRIHLAGTGEAGPWVLLARALAGDAVQTCTADLGGFGFSKVQSLEDPLLLPGGLKYGGIGGLAALAVPGELTVAGTGTAPQAELQSLQQVYRAAGAPLTLQAEALTRAQVVDRLLQRKSSR